MLLKRRVERGMDTMREKNRRYLEEKGEYTGPEDVSLLDEEKQKSDVGQAGLKDYLSGTASTPPSKSKEWELADEFEREKEIIAEYRKKNEELEFEKGDLPAIIIAAFITFGPVILGILGVGVLIVYLLGR